MENTDNTLRDMQEQLQQLKSMLDSQRIVNDKILRKACSQNIGRLKFKSNLPIVFGIAAILMTPALYRMGFSLYFVIFTCVMMLFAILATVVINRHIPSLDRNLVTAADELRKYRKMNADWIKIGLPLGAVWIGILLWEAVKHLDLEGADLYGLIAGVSCGFAIGLVVGFKLRRDQLDAADSLLSQIEELRKE